MVFGMHRNVLLGLGTTMLVNFWVPDKHCLHFKVPLANKKGYGGSARPPNSDWRDAFESWAASYAGCCDIITLKFIYRVLVSPQLQLLLASLVFLILPAFVFDQFCSPFLICGVINAGVK